MSTEENPPTTVDNILRQESERDDHPEQVLSPLTVEEPRVEQQPPVRVPPRGIITADAVARGQSLDMTRAELERVQALLAESERKLHRSRRQVAHLRRNGNSTSDILLDDSSIESKDSREDNTPPPNTGTPATLNESQLQEGHRGPLFTRGHCLEFSTNNEDDFLDEQRQNREICARLPALWSESSLR